MRIAAQWVQSFSSGIFRHNIPTPAQGGFLLSSRPIPGNDLSSAPGTVPTICHCFKFWRFRPAHPKILLDNIMPIMILMSMELAGSAFGKDHNVRHLGALWIDISQFEGAV